MRQQEVWVTSIQERQLAALAPLMADEPLIPLTILDGMEREEPLEKGRIYKRLSLEEVVDIIAWSASTGYKVQFGRDADGREYVQY